MSNLKFLNHSCPPLGISVTIEMASGDTGNSSIDTLEFKPVKFNAKAFVTSACPPFNFSQNLQQPAFLKALATPSSLSVRSSPSGSVLRHLPDRCTLLSILLRISSHRELIAATIQKKQLRLWSAGSLAMIPL